MMAYLYELADAYQALLSTDELTEEELATCLNNITGLFNEKAVNIGKVILDLQADTVVIAAEEKRLSERRQARNNRIQNLKSYLAQEMDAVGIDKVKDELFNISLVKNQPSVNILDSESISKQFRRIIPETWEVDKKKILEYFKTFNEAVSGTEIITDKKHVVIK